MAGVAGPAIALALGFSLGVVAAISLLLLFTSSRITELSVEPSKVRTFKHESKTVFLKLRARDSKWALLGSVSLRTPFGVAGGVKQFDSSSAELALTPEYSGRFEGFALTINTTDVLGTFLREEEVQLNLIVESLPRALLTEVRPLAVFPLIVGEIPAGRGGGGQEIYSVEEYQPSLDTRDILWKRVAKATDSRIPVRVREANIRKSVSVGVAVGWDSVDERTKRMDLVSEAMAQIGKLLLSAHTEMNVSLLHDGWLFRARASTLAQLADATVGVWVKLGDGDLRRLVLDSDMIIAGPKEYSGDARSILESKPSVLVYERPVASKALRDATIFTGNEDLSAVAAQVLQR